MSKLKITTITRKVISYCALPEKVRKSMGEEVSCDTYIEHRVTPLAEQANFDDDFTLDNYLLKQDPLLAGITLFIHIDY